jgi:hypothetical protein
MFKKAYARGTMKALLDAGVVKIANEDLAAAVADQAAEGMPEQPLGEVPPEVSADLVANLVDLSNSLQEGAESAAAAANAASGGEAPGAEAPAEEATEAPPSPEEKTGALKNAAARLRRKLSADTGSTIVGDRPVQENRPENTPSAEAKLDAKNRPGGDSYANVGEDGVGGQQDSGAGAIASERKREGVGMGPAEGGSNSATEAVKGASLRAFIRKVAMGKSAEVPGTTIDGSKPSVDAITGEGELEKNRRPEGYANVGVDAVGNSALAAGERAAAVGTEEPHPGQPAHEGGSNTVIDQAKTSADKEFVARFIATGKKYASLLPFYMDENEKTAAIQYLMSLPPFEQARVMSGVEKTAELPEGLKNYIANKKDGEGEKKDDDEKDDDEKNEEEKKEEKKEEAKKEASARRAPKSGDVIARLRQLSR